jgi:hypothetical protein
MGYKFDTTEKKGLPAISFASAENLQVAYIKQQGEIMPVNSKVKL